MGGGSPRNVLDGSNRGYLLQAFSSQTALNPRPIRDSDFGIRVVFRLSR